jgi:periplasmic protein TonB
VTGTGQTYAGGSTTSSGTNRQAVTTPDVDPRSHEDRLPDQSSSIALLDPDWSCPWPHEADGQDVDEQIVVVRVVVRVDGTVVRAHLVTDPGRGFGAAALACAEKARFVPAHDPAGKPIEATSPPIRVRFTR